MILIHRGIRGYMQRRAAIRMQAATVAPTGLAGQERPLDPDAAISVRGLRMAYGVMEAVRGIDLQRQHHGASAGGGFKRGAPFEL